MDKQYNLLADKYDILLNATPFRPYIEAYTFFSILGDVKGLRVLDLATGTGYYARACAKMGAAEVVGIDVSDQMIGVAQHAEADEPLGVRYEVSDAGQFKADQPFDLVIAVYLLHYAPNREILQAMCQNIADNLKPGGRFVTYQMNPAYPDTPGYYEKYGLYVTHPRGEDGEQLSMRLELGGEISPELAVYRWNKETLEEAFTQAGFTSIQWHQPRLSPEWQKTSDDPGFFEDYLAVPHAVIVEMVKANPE